jgi:hypothetical protein
MRGAFHGGIPDCALGKRVSRHVSWTTHFLTEPLESPEAPCFACPPSHCPHPGPGPHHEQEAMKLSDSTDLSPYNTQGLLLKYQSCGIPPHPNPLQPFPIALELDLLIVVSANLALPTNPTGGPFMWVSVATSPPFGGHPAQGPGWFFSPGVPQSRAQPALTLFTHFLVVHALPSRRQGPKNQDPAY